MRIRCSLGKYFVAAIAPEARFPVYLHCFEQPGQIAGPARHGTRVTKAYDALVPEQQSPFLSRRRCALIMDSSVDVPSYRPGGGGGGAWITPRADSKTRGTSCSGIANQIISL